MAPEHIAQGSPDVNIVEPASSSGRQRWDARVASIRSACAVMSLPSAL